MEPAVWSEAADAPGIRDGVVSRPGLFDRLARARRVVQVSAPPGSGKTILLRSWIAAAGEASDHTTLPVFLLTATKLGARGLATSPFSPMPFEVLTKRRSPHTAGELAA